MTVPLEGAPDRVELAVRSAGDDPIKVIAAPGFPVFLAGRHSKKGFEAAVRIDPEEIPELIELLREQAERAGLPFFAHGRKHSR
jgi:hypothetical protein